jgi:methionyl-tRNA formyltransferase
MSKLSKLVFFGTEGFSVPSLEKLLAEDWPVAAVVTKTDGRGGRGQKTIVPKVKQTAAKAGIEVWQPKNIGEIDAEIARIKPTHGILVAYGKIIPQATIDLFPGGIINVHPSLLPRYRGSSPIESAILNGDSDTGVCLMRLSAGVDAGPVYAHARIKLNGSETRLQLYDELAQKGADLLLERLPAIIEGWLAPTPQDDKLASYSQLLKKSDGLMDFSQPAEVYEQQVRAFLGFPKSRAKLHGHEVVITKARVAQSADDGALVVVCKPGFLEILELTAPSGRRMSGKDFLHGYSK